MNQHRGENFVEIRDTRHYDPSKCTAFCVPRALCFRSPVQKVRPGGPEPTVASVARAVRRKSGQHDVGDPLATELRGRSLDEVYEIAADRLGEKPESLRQKYSHLDNGRQRMVLGNRMRATMKKEGTL